MAGMSFPWVSKAFYVLCGIVAGYLFGGWVYEAAGDHVWEQPVNLIYDYQTLVGGVFALVAAYGAWRAVKSQIVADDERERLAHRRRLVAVADVLTTELMLHAQAAERGPFVPIQEVFGAIERSDVLSVAEIEPTLAATVMAYAIDIEGSRQQFAAVDRVMGSDGPGLSQRMLDDHQRLVREFSFRAEALAESLNKAARLLEAKKPVEVPLITETRLKELAEKRSVEYHEAVGYLLALARPPPPQPPL
jgi:hypothetical protein